MTDVFHDHIALWVFSCYFYFTIIFALYIFLVFESVLCATICISFVVNVSYRNHYSVCVPKFEILYLLFPTCFHVSSMVLIRCKWNKEHISKPRLLYKKKANKTWKLPNCTFCTFELLHYIITLFGDTWLRLTLWLLFWV